MKKMFMTLMSAATLLIASPILANTFIDGDDDKFVYIQADGTGTNKIEALNSAWVEAIRAAVGMYITGKTHINNDDVQEKITAYSRGKVKTYEIISENQQDGLWNIAIKAAVEKDMLVQAEKSTRKTHLSTAQLASFVTTSEKGQDARDTIDNFIIYSSPEECLDYSFDIQNIDGKVYAFHLIKVNHRKFNNIVSKNIGLLMDEIADAKIEIPQHPSYKDKHNSQVKQADSFSIPKQCSSIQRSQGDTILLSPVSNGRFEPYASFYCCNKDIPAQFQDDRSQRYKKISIASTHKKCTSYFISDEEISNKIWEKLIGKKYDLTFTTDIECNSKNIHFESDTLSVRFFSSAYFSSGLPSEGRIIYPLFQIKHGTSAMRSFYIFIAHEIAIQPDEIRKITNISGGYELSHVD